VNLGIRAEVVGTIVRSAEIVVAGVNDNFLFADGNKTSFPFISYLYP
jgi:hypothetical protein